MTEKNKIYTATDFERYHAGTMPADEMHELEKAALEDPFLGDALEGYTYTSSFENDITELKKRLDEKRKKKNVFTISSIAQGGWWRVAALFIIIAGAGYFFYRLNNKSKESAIAKNEIKSVAQKEDTALFNKDSITNNVVFENQNIVKNEQKLKSISSDSPVHTLKEDNAYASKNKALKKDNDKNTPEKYLLKGKVTDDEGKPLAFATIKNKSKNEAALTDTTGRFLLPSIDSNTTAVASAAGYSSKEVTLQKNKEPVIAMNKSESNLDEVVVTGNAQKKKSRSTGSKTEKLNGRVSGVEIKSQDTTTVLSNNEKFDQYLKANVKPVSEGGTLLTGEVLLSFTINKKGRPRNIKVIKSSCKECETEAIRLLENGPHWTIEKQKLKTVLIKF